MNLRFLLAALCLTLVSSLAQAQWEDTPRRRSSSNPGQAPTGIVVHADVFDDEWEEAPKRKDSKTKESESTGRRRSAPDDDVLPSEVDWTAPEPRRGLVVIEEDVSVSSTVVHGLEDPDRIGRSLGASEKKGLSLGVSSPPSESKSYRIRPEDVDDTIAPSRGRQESRATRTKAPAGMMVPVGDFEETPRRSNDPWGSESRQREPTRDAPRGRSLLDDLGSSSFGGSYGSAPSVKTHGDGSAIPVREVEIDYSKPVDTNSGSSIKVETVEVDYDPGIVVDVGARKSSPAPAEKRPPATPLPPPAPVSTVVEEPEPLPPPAPRPSSRRAVGTKAKANTPALSYDPFEKLERDLAEAEGRVAPEEKPAPEEKAAEPEPLPEYEIERPKAQPLETPVYSEPEMSMRPMLVPEEAAPTRDPSLWGLSALAGLGMLTANDPVSGFTVDFAYGLMVRLQPFFTGPFSLDLSFFRGARSDGTPVASVEAAWHHFASRIFYTREFEKGLYMGVGGGLLLTHNSVQYAVNDGFLDEAQASTMRAGADLGAVFGMRFSPVEVRVDMRALVRGGMRLDFLPTLSVGVSI